MTGLMYAFLALLFIGFYAYAFKYGAPPYMCKNPLPSHGTSTPQTTPSPFILSANVVDNENGIVRVRIHSSINSTSNYFTGYLVRIQNITPFLEKSLSTGIFSLEHTDGTVFQCQNEPTSAVTHDTNIKKHSLDIKWQAPAGFTGEVIFTSTIVVNFTHFWMRVESSPILVSRKPLAVQPKNELDQPLNTTLEMMHKNCGITKNCLYTPDSCITNNSCEALLTITKINDVYDIEIFSKSAKYAAMGISEDFNMGADAVTECAYEEPNVKAYRSWNVPRRKTNKRQFDHSGVKLIRGLYENGMIYCKIHVTPVFEIDGYKFDLNKKWYYVTLASGRELLEGKPGIAYHDAYRVSPNGRYYLPAITVDPEDELFYESCGNDTVCHGVPGTCMATKNCRFAVKVRAQDSKFVISMLTHRSMYVAVGFTEDQRRGNDHIVECLNNRTNVQTWRSWNVPGVFDNIRMGQTGLELISGRILKDGGLECTVIFDPSVIPSFKLDLKYYFILAGGSTLGSEKVGYHNLARSINDANIGLHTNSTREVRDKLFYNGCGENRTCLGYPDDCVATKSCDYAVSIAPDNVRDIYSFHIVGSKSPGYVALGLSEDTLMGDDLVVECTNVGNGSAEAFLSYNEPDGKRNRRIDKKPAYFFPTYGSFDGEKLECIALIKDPQFKLENKSFDFLREKYFLMLAVGKHNNSGASGASVGLTYHNVLYTVSSQAITLRVVKGITPLSRMPVYIHEILMIISWIALSNLGIIVARYYRSSWKDDNALFGYWFKWHKYCMVSATALAIASVVVIYFHCGRIITTGPASNHAFLGFATTALAFFQLFVAALRPDPGSTKRIFFNILHSFLGNILHLTAISAMFLAVELPKARLPLFTYWVLISYVIHYILVHLLLTFVNDMHTYKGVKESMTKVEKDNGNTKGSQRSNEYLVNSAYWRFKNLVFKYYLGATLVLVFFLVMLVLNE